MNLKINSIKQYLKLKNNKKNNINIKQMIIKGKIIILNKII
jgi:hypothetical protein